MRIRSGMTRHVLLVGRWAVKVPRVAALRQFDGAPYTGGRWRLFVAGVLHNLNESRDGRDPSRPFAPARFSLAGFLLVAERAEELAAHEWATAEAALAGYRDVRPSNVGRLRDGRIVLVDYA